MQGLGIFEYGFGNHEFEQSRCKHLRMLATCLQQPLPPKRSSRLVREYIEGSIDLGTISVLRDLTNVCE
jgi:hypothetical protein